MISSDFQAALILRGHTLAFRADPFAASLDEAVSHHADGAVAIAGGKIIAVGPAADIVRAHPTSPVEHYPHHIIMAGFVDCHAHYPQTRMIASYGEQLL